MKELEYRFMIPLESSVDAGFMLDRARSQAGILEEVLGELVEGSPDVGISEAARLLKRIDIFVENTKFEANKRRGSDVFPIDEDKRLGMHDAYEEVRALVVQEGNTLSK